MKRMKKLLAVLLTVAMVMSMGTITFAGAYDITVENANGNSGHIYIAYQIFTGTLSGTTLSDVTWGSDVTVADASAFVTAIKADATMGSAFSSLDATSTTLAADVAKILSDNNSSAEFAEAFATFIKGYITGSGTTSSDNNDGTYTISLDDPGYYLVVDSTDATLGNNDAYSRYMLKVTGPTTLTTKEVVPTIDKDVDYSGTYGDYNTAKVGDTVDFKLTITTPTSFVDYDTYQMIISDTLSNGLTLDASTIQITIGSSGTPTTVDEYDATASPAQNIYYAVSGQSLTITIADLLTATGYTAGDTLTVTYSATLNSNAVKGNDGNTNTATLSYSNDPYSSSTGTTTPTVTTTYTTSLTVYKTDSAGDFLGGSAFTLYASNGVDVVQGPTPITSNSGISFSGLTEGTYVLKETTTPAGYNTAEDITFTLSYDTSDGWTVSGISPSDVTISNTSGVFSTTVVNNSGTELPATGGIGTTIFYIVGAVLVLGAGVILITRRRMASR